jgi:hypothetical protein
VDRRRETAWRPDGAELELALTLSDALETRQCTTITRTHGSRFAGICHPIAYRPACIGFPDQAQAEALLSGSSDTSTPMLRRCSGVQPAPNNSTAQQSPKSAATHLNGQNLTQQAPWSDDMIINTTSISDSRDGEPISTGGGS